jgi:hypothetical protein
VLVSQLGYQVLCSLPDIDLDAEQVRTQCELHGFDPDEFVPARQNADSFRSACASLRQRKGVGHGRVQILADEVENTPTTVAYQITRVVWNLTDRAVEHEKNLLIEYSKATGEITAKKLDRFDPALSELLDVVRSRFEAAGGTVRGRRFRHAVRDQILALGGQRLLPETGVYFVPAAERAEPILSLLLGLVTEMYGSRARFHILPVADGESERRVIAAAIGLNAVEAADRIAARAMLRVREGADRAVRADLLANLREERRVLLVTVKQWLSISPELFADTQLALAVERVAEAMRQLEELAAIA